MLLAWGRAGALARPHLLGALRPGARGLHRLQALRQRRSSSAQCRAMAQDAPGALMRIGSKSFGIRLSLSSPCQHFFHFLVPTTLDAGCAARAQTAGRPRAGWRRCRLPASTSRGSRSQGRCCRAKRATACPDSLRSVVTALAWRRQETCIMLPRHKLVFDTGRCPQVRLGCAHVFLCCAGAHLRVWPGGGRRMPSHRVQRAYGETPSAARVWRATECSAQCTTRPCC